MHINKGLILPVVLDRNLQVRLLSIIRNLHLIDEMNFEASWKVEFGFELPSSKGFNSFLYGPSGMKFGTCIV